MPIEVLLAVEHFVTSRNSTSYPLRRRFGACLRRNSIHGLRVRWLRIRDWAQASD